MKLMYGVINAMTTPFNEDGSIDVESLKKQVDFQIEKGVNCLYPLGTTGEMYLLSPAERKLVAETVVKHAAGRAVVYIHVGAMTTAETCELAAHAQAIGADGIGAVTPSYFGCSDRAIIQYYKDISAAVGKDFPIYMYSIPQCSGNDIQPAVAQAVVDQCDNVVGIKYSYPDMVRILNYINVSRGDRGHFSVLVGPDKLFLAGLVSGADGCVSGCAGPVPEAFVAIYKAYQAGDLQKARELQRTAIKVIDIVRCGSDMGLFKEVLRRRGIVANALMRRPLLELEKADGDQVWEDLKPFLK